MEIFDELLISTAKTFVKETGKKELFLQEKEIKSLIEVYNLYNKKKNEGKHLFSEKLFKEKKEKLPKNEQTKENNEVKKRKKTLLDQEIFIKKSKKQKNETKKEYSENETQTKILNTNYSDKENEKENEIAFENIPDIQLDKKEVTDNLGSKKVYNGKNLEEKKDVKEKPKKKSSFSRIDISKVEFAHNSLKDNSYAIAYKGEQDEYGTKANRDLIFTKGKEFRAEKSKKKKGSYHGGKINTNISRSFKFT
ncbi:unnamed protein product [Pneumocystis jirovecii]|uniref:Srp40 C-terminal domain-containing protein n=1 Tax=Pneumocystis jirovecii TaxID=42068 RepID=L0PB36_PNEJI|nr:unnamed protein product [Pneumocystis jirovecii]